MCKCDPECRTPFCGKPGCEWPAQKPTYSDDPVEESRLCKIRDNPASRVRLMAEDRERASRGLIPFHDVELTWISEHGGYCPLMSAPQAWAMIYSLASELRRAREKLATHTDGPLPAAWEDQEPMTCSVCGRLSMSENEVCGMRQPSGDICQGTFV